MNLLKSEYLKFFYHKWLLLTSLSTIVIVPLFIIYLHETPNRVTENYVLSQMLQSFYLGQAGFIIISVLFIGQEFSRSTLRTSLLVIPSRWKFFFTKLLVLVSMVMLIWLLLILSSIILIKIFYHINMSIEIFYHFLKAIGMSISLILICASLVFITKSLVFSLGLSLSFLLGLGQLLLQFSPIFLYFPILSTMNVFLVVENPPYLPVSTGIMVQNLWGILLLALSIFLLKIRVVR